MSNYFDHLLLLEAAACCLVLISARSRADVESSTGLCPVWNARPICQSRWSDAPTTALGRRVNATAASARVPPSGSPATGHAYVCLSFILLIY